MITVPALEWHITDACNLTCEGCAHFSNHGHSNLFSMSEIESWYATWSKRIAPERIAILGGEPLLNKQVTDIVRMTRQYWNSPATGYFELVTNGFLMHRYPDLPKALADADCTLSISMHHDGSRYLAKFGEVMALAMEWRNRYGININIYNSSTEWFQIYRGFGDDMIPFEDGDIERSWENCITGQQCWQLYHNKIYKCPMVAYLPLQKARFDLSPKWDPYLEYQPLLPEATDPEIEEFFSRAAESVCGMCPANPVMFKKQDPLLPVKFYKNRKHG